MSIPPRSRSSFLSLLATAFAIASLPRSRCKTQMQAAWGCLAQAKQAHKQGEYRVAAFHLDCANQHRLWARYFRRYPDSPREPTVG